MSLVARCLWGLFLSLSVAACGDGGPSTGQCTGRIGTTSVDGPIDSEASQIHRIRKTSCATVDTAIFELSYGGGAMKIRGVGPWSNVGGMVAFTTATYPLPPTSESTILRSWELLSPTSQPTFSSGTITLHSAPPRQQGSFQMRFDDGSAVDCSFDLRRGETEGEDIDCGDGGDFDD
jgi:hypothetical protein